MCLERHPGTEQNHSQDGRVPHNQLETKDVLVMTNIKRNITLYLTINNNVTLTIGTVAPSNHNAEIVHRIVGCNNNSKCYRQLQ